MCVDTGVACSSSEILIFSVGDVLVRANISVFLCQPKVNDVNKVSFFAEPHQEVVWLDISMDEIFRMNELNPTDLKHVHKQKSHYNGNRLMKCNSY